MGDVTNDPDYLTALAATRSEVIVPVVDVMHDSVIGTIDVESELPHAFDSVTQSELREMRDRAEVVLEQVLIAEAVGAFHSWQTPP